MNILEVQNLYKTYGKGEAEVRALDHVLLDYQKPDQKYADAPTGNLDPKNSQEVIDLLKSMSAKYRQTILMITHNEDHADATDWVLRMTDGRMKDMGVAAR